MAEKIVQERWRPCISKKAVVIFGCLEPSIHTHMVLSLCTVNRKCAWLLLQMAS
jgi:hypothetical protein